MWVIRRIFPLPDIDGYLFLAVVAWMDIWAGHEQGFAISKVCLHSHYIIPSEIELRFNLLIKT